jgi:serine/threonine protein kinase
VEQIKNECKLQSFLDHPNIIKMYGWFSDVKNMYLILEYAPGGDLYNLMNMQVGSNFIRKE